MTLQVDPPTRAVGHALARDLVAEVKELHLALAQQPIVGPDRYGCFQISPLETVPPIVIDANVLHKDLARAAGRDERTVLVNAANSGMIRVFCAQHVLDEVLEHAARLARRAGVSVEKYLQVWQENYVPLLRLVEVPEGLLTADEAERVALLDHGPRELRDPDDVPTATLALQLGAVLLSTDNKVLWAVYGRDVDLTVHHAWLELLKLGGDAGALAKMKTEDVSALDVGALLVAKGMGWVWREVSPWACLILAGAAVYGVRKASPATRQRLGEVGVALIRESTDLSKRLAAAGRSLREVSVAEPAWRALTGSLQPQAVLTRACLYTLARVGGSDLSASELALELPVLDAAQGETKVRATLRRTTAFHQPYQGRFQVGRPAVSPSSPQS